MTTKTEPVNGTAPVRRVRSGTGGGRERLVQWTFVLPMVVFLLLFFCYPVLRNLTMSFQEWTVASFYEGGSPFVGLDNYVGLLTDPIFGTAVLNTVLFTVGSLAPQFAIGLGLAVFFQRRFPLSGVLRGLLLLPWLLPLVVSGAVFRWIYDEGFGVLNQLLLGLHLISDPVPWLSSTRYALLSAIIANVWVGVPFNLVILHSGLQAVPGSLYEAAALDGAGPWQRFRHITLPLLRPVIAIVLMLGLIYTLKVFDMIMILTGGGPANASETLTTWSFALSFEEFDFGQGAAVGNILIVIALVFALFYLRSIRDTFQSRGGRG
ncbi:sugar ABC transporter permease [Actinopolyspora erythraea]|uniref:ABC transporter permease n=1 Tax=Actinopolyspora erythraea TaxID=414996 RepID=A0A099D7J6_9ACTN|nr:sugar ABC transporter permease [Actinopolyspora erythraea]ASU78341.1 sugar ABC transporter permease [Actinopolyspora erythraea]KGI81969.1 ABC transporter permease [Actinopolyspora erythraea]